MSKDKTSTGYRSTGYRSTGDYSTGDWSTGHWSTGDWSTGHWSTGDWSTGDWSTGHWSTGHWSISNYSVGHFSTEDYSPYGAFNKPCTKEDWDNCEKPDFIYFNIIKWISSSDMTNQEKEDNQSHITTGGYLKSYDYKEAFQKSWDEADEEDRKKIFNLPNFDAEVFKDISGIDVNKDSNKSKKIAELEDKAQYIADELKKLKQ